MPVAHAAGDGTASAWRFTWLDSWQAIWEPAHLADWRATITGDGVHATPFMHPDLVRAWLAAHGGEAAWLPYFLRATHWSASGCCGSSCANAAGAGCSSAD